MRIYVDMDDVLCDFMGAYNEARERCPEQAFPQAAMDFFRRLKPLPGAIEAMQALSREHEVWILTKPSYMNPFSYTEKRLWVEDHLGLEWCQRLILCPDKTLLKGDVLIDDQSWVGFEGQRYLFGSTDSNGTKIDWAWMLKALTWRP